MEIAALGDISFALFVPSPPSPLAADPIAKELSRGFGPNSAAYLVSASSTAIKSEKGPWALWGDDSVRSRAAGLVGGSCMATSSGQATQAEGAILPQA